MLFDWAAALMHRLQVFDFVKKFIDFLLKLLNLVRQKLFKTFKVKAILTALSAGKQELSKAVLYSLDPNW